MLPSGTRQCRQMAALQAACMFSLVAITSLPKALAFTLPIQLRALQSVDFVSAGAGPFTKRLPPFSILGKARQLSTGVMSTQCKAERSTVSLPTGVEMEYFHAQPTSATNKPPIVFVHGSFHGGWCWAEHWMPYFAEQGYASYSPSLRGTSGTAVAEGTKSVDLSEHTADIEAFIAAVLPPETKPILAGHSFGGLYAQKVAETMQRPLAGLVMLASVGPSGTSGTVNRYIWSKPFLAWSIVMALVFKRAATDEVCCRKVFFGEDVSSADISRYMDHFKLDCKVGLNIPNALKQFPSKTCMTPEGTCAWLDRAPPILVVGAREDKIVDEPAVIETADFYKTAPQWAQSSHELMLVNGWKASADLVIQWLQQTQSAT